jgi:triosephosphate isomerase
MTGGSASFYLGTGWKMNKTRREAEAYARALRADPRLPFPGVRLFVLPPFTALAATRDALGDAPVAVGAQDVHWEDSGAFTGEVSAPMVKECGAELVALGHAERRRLFGETDAWVALKTRACLRHGLRPLVCVGETAEERAAGAAAETVLRQARLAFAGLGEGELARCLLAYEPVWAIGEGGDPAGPGDVAPRHAALAHAFPGVPVLYGGGVDLGNAAALARVPHVSGLFVGRAAWEAEGLLALAALVSGRGRD